MIYLFILQTSRYIVVRRAIIDISYEKDFYTPQTSHYIAVERGIIDNCIWKMRIGIVGGLARWAGKIGWHGGPARMARELTPLAQHGLLLLGRAGQACFFFRLSHRPKWAARPIGQV